MVPRSSYPDLFFLRGLFIQIKLAEGETPERWEERVVYVLKRLARERDFTDERVDALVAASYEHVNRLVLGVDY